MAQGDWLHCTTRVARKCLLAADLRLVAHRHALDGVDGRNSICTGKVGPHGRLANLRDVGCHLGDDRYLHAALHVGGIEGYQFWVLPHIAAHARKTHLRAREVQLYGIATCGLGHLCKLGPLLLELPHDGGHDHLRGIVALQPSQNVEVHLVRILRQLLHIAEPGKARITLHGIEAWRHLADFLLADSLVKDTRPTGIEGPCHHIIVGTHG